MWDALMLVCSIAAGPGEPAKCDLALYEERRFATEQECIAFTKEAEPAFNDAFTKQGIKFGRLKGICLKNYREQGST